VRAAAGMGEVMGLMHGKTHVKVVSAETAVEMTKVYKNEKLRGIQLEYVYTKVALQCQSLARPAPTPPLLPPLLHHHHFHSPPPVTTFLTHSNRTPTRPSEIPTAQPPKLTRTTQSYKLRSRACGLRTGGRTSITSHSVTVTSTPVSQRL
jgi:hypothetical protein